MRRTVVIGLSLLVSAAALGGARALFQQARYRRAAVAAATTAVRAAAPIPQDAAATTAVRAAAPIPQDTAATTAVRAAAPIPQDAAATTAVRAAAPIPQDAAAIEKRRHDRLAWNRQTLQGAYDEVGKKDARWDEPARKTMELAARMFSEEVDPEVMSSDVYTSAKAAVDAGCDDPMLVYLYNRSSVGPNDPGKQETIRRAKDSAKALAANRYPAIRRAIAFRISGGHALSASNPGDEGRKEAERDFDAALALLEESVASDERNEFWEANWSDTLADLIRGYRTLGVPAEAAYERVDAGLSRVADAKILRLLFRGAFWFHYGWEARTTGFAAAVPAGGFDVFGKRLEVARKALNQAWELQPGLGAAAPTLIEIDKGIGGDRATMELWFDRAMKANGDDRAACWSKLDWLDPKALGDRLTQWSEFPYIPLADLKRNRNHTAEILMGNRTPIGLPGWHFIGGKNDDGHWRVNIPVAPERKQEAGILGAKARNVWTCTADGIAYTIRVQPVPPALRNEVPERVLDAARAVVAEERGGQPRDVRDAKLANRPAQEYHVDAPPLRPKLIRVRTAVIGTRLYELSVTASETDVASKAVNEFFDSFTFREVK